MNIFSNFRSAVKQALAPRRTVHVVAEPIDVNEQRQLIERITHNVDQINMIVTENREKSGVSGIPPVQFKKSPSDEPTFVYPVMLRDLPGVIIVSIGLAYEPGSIAGNAIRPTTTGDEPAPWYYLLIDLTKQRMDILRMLDTSVLHHLHDLERVHR